MELRHLRYFAAAAEESTIVAAAKRLRIAQPALTRQIHDLEREIGVDLFERGAKGIELTPAGEVCLQAARHILTQVNVAMHRARGASRGVVGRCVICVGARGLTSGLIARIVELVHSEFPDIDLVVTEGAGAKQFDAMRMKEADIGLGLAATAEYPELVSETFDHDVFDAVIVSRHHELAGHESLDLAALADYTWVTWHARFAPNVKRQLSAEFARRGFVPTVREFDQVADVVAMVSAGRGWTFLPRKLAALAPSDAVLIPLNDFRYALPHAIVTRQDEASPVVHTVIDSIRRVGADDRRAIGLAPMSHPSPAPVRASSADGLATEQAIELRHLRYYCAVVEERSFGRAAERLELTQPALSRQIRDLERAIGESLLERAARGATVTPAGDSFYRSARHILDEANAIKAEADRAHRGMQARCVIAVVPTPDSRALIADLLRRSAELLPKIEIRIVEYHTPKQPDVLRSATVDLGLCHATPLSPVEERELAREHLVDDVVNCALVAADGPLSGQTELRLADLADVPFLFPNRDFQPGLYDLVFSIFEGNGFRPRVEQTYEGLKTIWTLVAEGRGWAIGSQSQCKDPPPGTVSIPVTGFELPWGIDLLSRDNESRSSILLIKELLHDIAVARGRRRSGSYRARTDL